MWIKKLRLLNIRSFEDETLPLSRRVNILVGPNNSGKSTVLLPLLSLQDQLPSMALTDVRIHQQEVRAEIYFEDVDRIYFEGKYKRIFLERNPRNEGQLVLSAQESSKGQTELVGRIQNREPNNFIYPFISKRKVAELKEQVTSSIVQSVLKNFENLNAKIDRLSNPELPANEFYMRACKDIFGFNITAAHTDGGKRAVYTVDDMQNIPLLAMGEGVMNILGLVKDLAMAKDKLFLIEEPENDVHPRALKILLGFIAEKSENNQFIITTHSNIVLKQLGALPEAKIFHFEFSLKDRLPTSTIREIEPTCDARKDILDELGYEFSDLDLWDAWLVLEESSAEKIIREYLIPWFAPKLVNRLRTYSARSLSQVSQKFDALNNLLVFLHLEPMYKKGAWVVVDGGEEEKKVIDKLKDVYTKSGWSEDRFLQLSQHDFEQYYPDQFREDVNAILPMQGGQEKQALKKSLLEKVEAWIASNDEDAKDAFEKSAADVIKILRQIETEVVR